MLTSVSPAAYKAAVKVIAVEILLSFISLDVLLTTKRVLALMSAIDLILYMKILLCTMLLTETMMICTTCCNELTHSTDKTGLLNNTPKT